MTAHTVLTFSELPVEHHFDGPCLASSRSSLKASNDIFLRETKAVGDEGLTVDFLLFQEIQASWVLHQTESQDLWQLIYGDRISSVKTVLPW